MLHPALRFVQLAACGLFPPRVRALRPDKRGSLCAAALAAPRGAGPSCRSAPAHRSPLPLLASCKTLDFCFCAFPTCDYLAAPAHFGRKGEIKGAGMAGAAID